MEPMRLHAEDVGDMGRTVCTPRLMELFHTATSSHLGKSLTKICWGSVDNTQRPRLFAGRRRLRSMRRPAPSSGIALCILPVNSSAWVHIHEMEPRIWCSHDIHLQPARPIHKRVPRQPYWFRTCQERLVEKDPEGRLHHRLSCVYTYMYMYASIDMQRLQREDLFHEVDQIQRRDAQGQDWPIDTAFMK